MVKAIYITSFDQLFYPICLNMSQEPSDAGIAQWSS
jgi:hypothetical protein